MGTYALLVVVSLVQFSRQFPIHTKALKILYPLTQYCCLEIFPKDLPQKISFEMYTVVRLCKQLTDLSIKDILVNRYVAFKWCL